MKKLVNLKGVKTLNRKEQKAIFGGDPIPHGDGQGGSGGGGKCKSCTKNSECASGVCATYSGPDCGTVECGCGSWCL